MANEMSFKARISAIDNFSGTFNKISDSVKKAGKSVENINPPTDKMNKFGQSFKDIAGGVVIGNVVTGALSKISGALGGLMGELSQSSATWQTFNGVMQNFGKSGDEIASVKKELQSFATQTIYSSSDMASTYSQLAAVGVKNTTALVKGFGGLAGAAENPAQAMKSLSQQATQMASKPKVAWEDFKIMLEQSPAGMSQVAKEMGMSLSDLVKKVQDGSVQTEDFFDKMTKAGNSDAFQKMATQYKTVGEAVDGLSETLMNKLQPAYDYLSKFAIKGISAVSDAIDSISFDGIKNFYNFIVKYGDIFKPLAVGLASAGAVFVTVTTAIVAYNKATAIAKTVSELFGRSLFANPLGLLVLVITAVVTALGYFFLKTESGRNVLEKLHLAGLKVSNFFGATFGKVMTEISYKMTDLSDHWDMFRYKLEDLGVFKKISNVLLKFQYIMTDLSDYWDAFRYKLEDLGVVEKATNLFSTLGGKFGALGAVVSVAISLITKLGLSFVGITGPVGIAISLLVSFLSSWAKTGDLNADGITEVFDNLTNTITSVADFISGNLPKFIEIGTSLITKLIDGMAKALPQIITTATQVITTVLTSLAKALPELITLGIDLITKLIDGFTKALPYIVGAVPAILLTIINAITKNLPQIAKAGIQIIQTLINSIVKVIPTLATSAVQIITTLVQTIVDNLPTIINSAIQIIMTLAQAIIDNLPTIIDSAIQIIMAIFNGLIEMLPTIIDGAIQIIMALVQGLIDNLPKIIDSAIQIITTLFQAIIDNLPKIIEAGLNLIIAVVSGLIDNLPKIIESALKLVVTLAKAIIDNLPKILEAGGRILLTLVEGIFKLIGKLWDLGVGLIQKLIDGIGSKINDVTNKAGEIGNSIWEKIKSIDLLQVGKDVIQGLINGIGSMVGAVGKAIGDVAGNITGGIKGALGIHSPSRVMRQIGVFTGQGLQIGIDSMGSKISKSADKMARLATPNISPIDVGGAFSNATGNFTSSLSADVQGQLQVSQQPAEINLSLGNRDFNAFVGDISRNQDQSTQLRNSYGF
ncbi:tape measure protein [Holzapfeliella sp. He02]|uniref:Tape measure protein n=1 Tax=Holzapfeliella saturejae TaxID=3082953 RepID=A0ABU8SIB4_9LACO